MEEMIPSQVVGVRFSRIGKIYHFEARDQVDLKVGDRVVVETSRGWQLGEVAQLIRDAQPPAEGYKLIDRRATPRDLLMRQLWQQKEAEVVETSRKRAGELRLNGVKVVLAEYSFDGSRLTILFSTETEDKYDLKSLRNDMQKVYGPSTVELRLIGPRDVAKTICGLGACGLDTRCCCAFLTEFSSISIRMAKEQGISLTPTEITGMCGRLRCCLIYEYDQYVEARKALPKRNKRVMTPQGEGKIIDINPMQAKVMVELAEHDRREFLASEITVLDAEGRPSAPAEGEQANKDIPVVVQPSEIDQVITGEEIDPDQVDGVGNAGMPPMRPRPAQQNRQQGNNPNRRDRTNRPDNRAQQPRPNFPRMPEGNEPTSGSQQSDDSRPSNSSEGNRTMPSSGQDGSFGQAAGQPSSRRDSNREGRNNNDRRSRGRGGQSQNRAQDGQPGQPSSSDAPAANGESRNQPGQPGSGNRSRSGGNRNRRNNDRRDPNASGNAAGNAGDPHAENTGGDSSRPMDSRPADTRPNENRNQGGNPRPSGSRRSRQNRGGQRSNPADSSQPKKENHSDGNDPQAGA